MIVPDTNLLLFASDPDSKHYDKATEWWDECLRGREAVALVAPVVFAFLRIITNQKLYAKSLSVAEAANLVRKWFANPRTEFVPASHDTVTEALDLLDSIKSVGGDLTTDAQIAAIALHHDATVHTADEDFRRFPGVKTFYPLEQPA